MTAPACEPDVKTILDPARHEVIADLLGCMTDLAVNPAMALVVPR